MDSSTRNLYLFRFYEGHISNKTDYALRGEKTGKRVYPGKRGVHLLRYSRKLHGDDDGI